LLQDKDQQKEVSREENVGTLHIARMHVQLRRLLKHSNFSDNIVLTAIPDHRSSVLFTFSYDSSSTTTLMSTPTGPVPASLMSGTVAAGAQPPGSPRRRLSRSVLYLFVS
jgi:hypothetical protein